MIHWPTLCCRSELSFKLAGSLRAIKKLMTRCSRTLAMHFNVSITLYFAQPVIFSTWELQQKHRRTVQQCVLQHSSNNRKHECVCVLLVSANRSSTSPTVSARLWTWLILHGNSQATLHRDFIITPPAEVTAWLDFWRSRLHAFAY